MFLGTHCSRHSFLQLATIPSCGIAIFLGMGLPAHGLRSSDTSKYDWESNPARLLLLQLDFLNFTNVRITVGPLVLSGGFPILQLWNREIVYS